MIVLVRNCFICFALVLLLPTVGLFIPADRSGVMSQGLLQALMPAAMADDDDRRGRRGPRRGIGSRRIGVPSVLGVPAFGIPLQFPAPRSRSGRTGASGAVRREWIAAGVDEADLARVRQAGFVVVAQRRLTFLPGLTVRLRAPRRIADRVAEARLRSLLPAAIIDRNHLYRTSARPCTQNGCFPYLGQDRLAEGNCHARGAVGMIDTAVDTTHPALAGVVVETELILGPGHDPSRSRHGTDVAILIAAGTPPSDFRLIGIDVFHRRGKRANADAFDIAAAIDRLSARSIRVVNLSFAGPPNELLRRAGEQAAGKGMIFIASAGNDGPLSLPRYPAAYDWAIAVTAVDSNDHVYRRAVRGEHIAFAAPGVRLQLPDIALRPGSLRSGTSYAAPWVTRAASAHVAGNTAMSRSDLLSVLASKAKDLGSPGRDPIFGFGLVGGGIVCPTS